MTFLRHLWPNRLYSQLLFAAAIALFIAQIINAFVMVNIMRERAINDAGGILINAVVTRAQFDDFRDDNRSRPMAEARNVQNQPFNQRRQERRQERQNRIQTRQEVRRSGQRRRGNIDIMRSNTAQIPASYVINQELSDRAAFIIGSGRWDSPVARIGDISKLPMELRGRAFQRQSQRQLSRGDAQIPTQAVLLSYQNEDGVWISAARAIRPIGQRAIWGLIFQTLLIYAILLSVLAFIAYHISKPLDRLKGAMASFGTGNSDDIPVQGPHDVRELIENYNDMRARISSLLSEKDVMLGAIGHDLKTPLASLRVRVESVDNNVEREHMIASIDDMNIMLSDILTLARLGNSCEAMQKTDITALVETVVDDFPNNGDDIIFAPADPIAASIRPSLLRRALRNIIGNALRYGGNAHISAARADNVVIITIDDDGPGIANDQMEAVFEPFERLDASRNSALGGTGLGLTISRAIMHAHGGDIILENRIPNGLRVIITLPLQ